MMNELVEIIIEMSDSPLASMRMLSERLDDAMNRMCSRLGHEYLMTTPQSSRYSGNGRSVLLEYLWECTRCAHQEWR